MKTVEVIVEHAGKNLSAYIEGASDNFKPSTSVKEKIFKKFKSFFD